ncbi:uncharacterized protein LOC132608217 [Lycium barbarum]|uniref:uncharacterized protein LOC132608217 n=1 Tax=Lycium barbarum TaxID=112863 RepID=UPI00293E2284|nr:uncharacterized protein LOC132608217 [Lycium barbarum]
MTNELSSSLQMMDQAIVNAMGLLALTKQRLQKIRDSEFELLMDDVSSFCDKYDIIIPNMDSSYPGRSKRRFLDLTYSHYLRVDIFYAVIDLHLQELKNRFDAVSSDLLLSMASLNLVNSFRNFDKNRIMRLAKCYMNEFDNSKLGDLSCQLDSFIVYARDSDKRYFNLKGISDLAKLLVKSDLHQSWPLVYLLIKLTLILPVTTASVERAIMTRPERRVWAVVLSGYMAVSVEYEKSIRCGSSDEDLFGVEDLWLGFDEYSERVAFSYSFAYLIPGKGWVIYFVFLV